MNRQDALASLAKLNAAPKTTLPATEEERRQSGMVGQIGTL